MTSKKTAVRSSGRQGATAPDTTTPTRKPRRSRPSPRELLDMVAPGQEVDPPADPARVAASLMLAAAMRAGRLWQADLTAPGVIVFVQTPTAEWVEPLRIAWARAVQGKAEPARDDGKRYRTDPDDGPLILYPGKQPEKWDREAGIDKFAAFVARQRGAVGISSDPEWLPPDLVAAADIRLSLSLPTPDDLMELARRLKGGVPGVRIATADAAAVTPRLARLAVRPDQTADDYLRKLLSLVHADRGTGTDQPPAERKRASGLRAEPTLERLHGMDEAVAWGFRLRDDLAAFRDGELSWSDVDRGLLLSGPPGVGKTLFARALATTCDVPLFSDSYATWSATGHQGDLLRAMRRCFREAKDAAPAILFIDEIDSFADRSRVKHYPEWHIEIVNALLAEIDGVEDREGVVVIGACNDPGRLDPALMRSGRLDRHVAIAAPSPAALAAITREHLGDDLPDENLTQVGLMLLGATGADVERLVRDARRRARLEKRDLELADVVAETGGPDAMEGADLLLTAIHEAGHAVCAVAVGIDIGGVTLRGFADQGRTRIRLKSPFATAADVHDRTVLLLAGRAAEEVLLGRVTSGAGGPPGSDLHRATVLVARSIAEFGLDQDHGLAWTPLPDRESELTAMLAGDRRLAFLVRDRLATAYADALKVVAKHRAAIEEVAERLLEKGALDTEEVEGIVAAERISP